VNIYEEGFSVPRIEGRGLIAHFDKTLQRRLSDEAVALRFAVVESDHSQYCCEVGVLTAGATGTQASLDSIFRFNKRRFENRDKVHRGPPCTNRHRLGNRRSRR
jgi:hypothetical protein